MALNEKPPGRQDRQVRNPQDFDGSDPGVFGVLAVKFSFSAPCQSTLSGT
jgi:hypothetical protein